MKMNVTRRDVLKFGAGGAVGAMLTPAPWKAIDDLAIWTQNWSWIPRPPRGLSTMRSTVCALCPAGCAAQARCISGLPVSMRAASNATPLCPLGLTGHHLPYHPARMTRPIRIFREGARLRRVPVPIDSIINSTARAIADARRLSHSVAVLDMRPGRSLSWAWQRLLGGIPGAVYIPTPGREGASMATLQQIVGTGDGIGLDLDGVRTIVSFGAPLAEGWGTPGRVGRALESGARLIQIDPVRTGTADMADRWLPVKAGAEAAVAHAIAHDLAAGNGSSEAPLPSAAAPSELATMTGIPPADIAMVARELANGPSIVLTDEGLGRETEEAILSLNLMMKESALVPRAELPAPFDDDVMAPVQEIDRIADRSISILLIDASAGDVCFPWSIVQQKLASNALVVALSPFFAGTVQNATYIVPTLPHLESLAELPTPFDSPAAQLTIAAPLLPPRKQAFDPAAFVRAVARSSQTELPGDWSKSEDLIRARVNAIHAKGEGTVATIADGSTKAVKDFASSDEMWEAMIAGARWQGECANRTVPSGRGPQAAFFPRRSEVRHHTGPGDLTLILRTPRDVTASGAVSPLMTKLYQESGLRRAPETAVVNPTTARQLGVVAGGAARLGTESGWTRVSIATDHAVMPGVVEMTAAPHPIALGDGKARPTRSVLDIVSPDARGSWRSVAVRLVAEA